MWYLIAYIAGFFTFFALVEWRTGLFTDWAVKKIDSWWEKRNSKMERRKQNEN